MSDMSTHLDTCRQADLARDPNHVAAAIANYEAARAAHPRLAAERAILRTVVDATQPRDVSRRAYFDSNYGPATDHWLDPRNDDGDEEAMTPEQAKSEATEQVLSYSESVADWLAKACDTDAGRLPIEAAPITPEQIMEAEAAVLVALLFTGDNMQVLRSAHRLRQMCAEHFRAEIDSRAMNFLAGAL